MIYYVRKSFNQSIFGETHVSSSAQEFFQIGSDLGDEPFRRCFVIVLIAIIWPFGFIIHSNWMISVSTWIKTTWGPLRIPVIFQSSRDRFIRAPQRFDEVSWTAFFQSSTDDLIKGLNHMTIRYILYIIYIVFSVWFIRYVYKPYFPTGFRLASYRLE